LKVTDSSRPTERIDPSKRLIEIHLRFLGIVGKDTRMFSEQQADEMIAAIQEPHRQGGTESVRQAALQTAHMDPSRRLMEIHLHFLGVGSNDCRLLRGLTLYATEKKGRCSTGM